VRHRKPENWLAAIDVVGDGIAEARPLIAREQASEALLMGLRLREGVDLVALAARLGVPAGELIDDAALALYAGQGLVWRDGQRIGVTDRGIGVLDGLLGELVPAGLLVP
jgi:oxygen-independent coproporphyrinogen-3 oxidase